MAIDIPKTSYTDRIKEIKLGIEDNLITVGGETCYPFHLFEGRMPNYPRTAMLVYDSVSDDWPETVVKPFADVIHDPAAWAEKCVDVYGAELICLQLSSTDPNDKNAAPAEAVATVKRVLDTIDVPLIVWGSENIEKDTEVFKLLCESCEGKNLVVGPVAEGNYRAIGATAIAYNHVVMASTPIDINLAKQLNILLGNLNVPDDKIIIDPSTGALGYGLEYSYSVIERIRMAALSQGDEKLQFPIIVNTAQEVWKTKEVKVSEAEAPLLGDREKRGIMFEALSAQCMLIAGADIIIMMHPGAVKLVKESIRDLMAS